MGVESKAQMRKTTRPLSFRQSEWNERRGISGKYFAVISKPEEPTRDPHVIRWRSFLRMTGWKCHSDRGRNDRRGISGKYCEKKLKSKKHLKPCHSDRASTGKRRGISSKYHEIKLSTKKLFREIYIFRKITNITKKQPQKASKKRTQFLNIWYNRYIYSMQTIYCK